MSKRIINVTTDRGGSDGNDDFKPWGLKPGEDNYQAFPKDGSKSDKRILVLRGSVLEEEEENEHGELVPQDLAQFKSEIDKFISEREEVGVLYHPGVWKNEFIQMLDMDMDMDADDLAFFREYSTSDDVPYEAYYKPLADASESEWDERFDDLWAYCEGDLVLEAKLNLLHELLVPPPDTSALEKEAGEDGEGGAWFTLRQHVENDADESAEDLKRYEAAWKTNFADADLEKYRGNPSESGYYDEEGPLTKLRDELLAAAS